MGKTVSVEAYVARRLSQDDVMAYENLYRLEHELMTRISLGLTPVNIRGVPPIGNPYYLELMPPKLRNLRNQFSVFAALGAERAIESGVDLRIAFVICGFYQRMAESASSPGEVDALAETMLEEFSRKVREYQIPPNLSPCVREAMLYIRQNIHRSLKIQNIAHRVGRSRSQLDRDFHGSLGMSPRDFLTQEKFRNAEAFLLYTDMTITEISQNTGFSSLSHFCTAFGRRNGMSPVKFRSVHSDAIRDI